MLITIVNCNGDSLRFSLIYPTCPFCALSMVDSIECFYNKGLLERNLITDKKKSECICIF